jgi:CheY-like chemotaxis protein
VTILQAPGAAGGSASSKHEPLRAAESMALTHRESGMHAVLTSPGTPTRVLFIDDNATSRRELARLMQRHGHEVDTVAPTAFALRLAQRRPYPVIAMRVESVGSGALGLLECLHEANPLTAFVLMTTDAQLPLPTPRKFTARVARLLGTPWFDDDLLAAIAHAGTMHATDAKRAVSAETRTTSMLLIEDNPGDVLLMQQYLERLDPPRPLVERAQRLEDALALLARRAFDVVLADVTLPDAGGLDGSRPRPRKRSARRARFPV